ncbi:MAG: ABC transporter substrate-binding protein [Bacteroidota bacterium]|nr:ABC transporter substrate-binding protein [Bacteroidota bacterium]
MRVFVSVDDTDSKESRGTGFRARQMGSELMLAGYGKVMGITRHQLYVHELIPYTSQNSSNCLEIEAHNKEKLWEFCRSFMLREAIPGSDVGLCIVEAGKVPLEVEEWGRRAKCEVLTQKEARDIADRNGIQLEGLTGTFDGIIGALAAIGLRNFGNDGRFIWQPGKQLRDLVGSMTVEQLLKGTQVDAVMTRDGKILDAALMIDLTDWIRAVLINSKTYIIAEKNLKRSGNDWKTADKLYLKELSS